MVLGGTGPVAGDEVVMAFLVGYAPTSTSPRPSSSTGQNVAVFRRLLYAPLSLLQLLGGGCSDVLPASELLSLKEGGGRGGTLAEKHSSPAWCGHQAPDDQHQRQDSPNLLLFRMLELEGVRCRSDPSHDLHQARLCMLLTFGKYVRPRSLV